jgi:hypothetical protein
MIPAVWVPPLHVRELWALIHHRQRLIAQQTRLKNQLQSLLHRHHRVLPGGKLFGAANRPWWLGLSLTSSEKLRLRQNLTLLDQLDPLITEVEGELNRLSLAEPWAEQGPFLLQLPGIGLITAMTILGAIGQIERFPTAKKLVGYAGLGPKSTPPAKLTAAGVLPNKAVKSCEPSWSRPPGPRCVTISTGRNSSSVWLAASVVKRPSSPLPTNFWSSSGTSCQPKSPTAEPNLSKSLAISSAEVANCGLRPLWVSRPVSLLDSTWIGWRWARSWSRCLTVLAPIICRLRQSRPDLNLAGR